MKTSGKTIVRWSLAALGLLLAGGTMAFASLRNSERLEVAVAAVERPVPVRPSYLVDVPPVTSEMLRAQEAQRRQAELVLEANPIQPEVTVVTASAEADGDRWVVVSEAVNVRSGPSNLNEVVGRLMQGEAVAVAEEQGGWLRTAGGWVYSKYLTRQ